MLTIASNIEAREPNTSEERFVGVWGYKYGNALAVVRYSHDLRCVQLTSQNGKTSTWRGRWKIKDGVLAYRFRNAYSLTFETEDKAKLKLIRGNLPYRMRSTITGYRISKRSDMDLREALDWFSKTSVPKPETRRELAAGVRKDANTRTVWSEYIRLAPPNVYKMNILTFPEPGWASTGSAGSKYFDVVRSNLAEVERFDLRGVDPAVAAHIRKSTQFWQKICKMQPALELEVLRRTAGLEADVIQEMKERIRGEGNEETDFFTRITEAGVVGGFQMINGLKGVEKLFDWHVQQHGLEAWEVLKGDIRISTALGVDPKNISSDQAYGQLYRALMERGLVP